MAPARTSIWLPNRTPRTWEHLGSNTIVTPGPVNERIAMTATGAPMAKVNSKLFVGPYGGTALTTVQPQNSLYTTSIAGGHGYAARFEDDPADRGPEHYRLNIEASVMINNNVPNQVFRECVIRGFPVGSAASATQNGVESSSSSTGAGLGGATFIDCLIEPPGDGTFNPWAHGISRGNFHLFRCEIKGWTDGVSLTSAASDTTIEWSWIHNGYYATGTYGDPSTPVNSDGKTHNDGIQFHHGQNIKIENNYIGGARNRTSPNSGDDFNNAGIMLKQEPGLTGLNFLTGVTINRNYFEGGESMINISPANGNDGAGWAVTNNRFVRRPSGYTGPANYILRNGTAGPVTGNVFDDTGLPVP